MVIGDDHFSSSCRHHCGNTWLRSQIGRYQADRLLLQLPPYFYWPRRVNEKCRYDICTWLDSQIGQYQVRQPPKIEDKKTGKIYHSLFGIKLKQFKAHNAAAWQTEIIVYRYRLSLYSVCQLSALWFYNLWFTVFNPTYLLCVFGRFNLWLLYN